MKVVDFSAGSAVARGACGCICNRDESYSAGYSNGSGSGTCGRKCYAGNAENNQANYTMAYNKVH